MQTINVSPNPLLTDLVYQLRMIGKLEPDMHKRTAYAMAVESLLLNADSFGEMAMAMSIAKEFKKLPGIGDSISSKIEEFLMTGKIQKLIDLQASTNESNSVSTGS